MPPKDTHLPLLPFNHEVDLSLASDDDAPDLSALPAGPGVFAFEDEAGGTLALAISANVRRLVRSRLEPLPENTPTRRVNYRALVHRVLALEVGGSFEAEWAYLQHARVRTPSIYSSLLDRWRGWFVHINPDTQFPRWTKTARPFGPPQGTTGRYFGPLPDKHAAARYMELLDDAFDLCRYHHLLVEAPHASACAYKEMGRCAAPCDGSISLEEYHATIERAVEFAAAPMADTRADLEQAMADAAADQDFEAAARLKVLYDRTQPATRADLARVRAIEAFRFVAIGPSTRAGWARVFIIRGGWIEPLLDLPLDARGDALGEALKAIREVSSGEVVLEGAAIENLGLVCWHLYRPKSERRPGEVIALDDLDTPRRLGAALKRLEKMIVGEADAEALKEQVMETPPLDR